jgi:hypothetical protein
MIELLPPLLRIAGAGMIVLALAHIQMSRVLRWREDAALMPLSSESVFHVHTFFVCATLVLMGLPAVLAPHVFIERTAAGTWLAWSFSVFWSLRLIVQWFVFPRALWRGKVLETRMHYMFTVVWLGLTTLFAVCGLVQSGHLV